MGKHFTDLEKGFILWQKLLRENPRHARALLEKSLKKEAAHARQR